MQREVIIPGRLKSIIAVDLNQSSPEKETHELNLTIHDIEFGRNNVGVWGTCFNIFKCFIGIGILALPSAYSEVQLMSLID